MFYSHEILTSRKYGVATIWLVATLGERSNLKKINRKAILDVDVQKACETILDPESPLALRLQSNLLYGVSRVYLQQCGYVLSDAQAAQSTIRAMLKAVRDSIINVDAGKARGDRLMLSDDPSFDPEMLNFEIDLSNLEIAIPQSSQTYILSPRTALNHSHADDEFSLPALVVPSSAGSNGGGIGGFSPTLAQPLSDNNVKANDDVDEGFFPDIDFEFDADGNVRDIDPAGVAQGESSVTGLPRLQSSRADHSGAIPIPGPQTHAALKSDTDQTMLDLPDYPRLPSLDPTSKDDQNRDEAYVSRSPSEDDEDVTTTAAHRRQRPVKQIRIDRTVEITSFELSAWKQEYADNMSRASRLREAKRNAMKAKKNAQMLVFGSGIGGSGQGIGRDRLQGPLAMFSGFDLMKLLDTDAITSEAGTKRSRNDDEEEVKVEGSEKRQRLQMSGEVDVGRNIFSGLEGRGTSFSLDNDVEIGRDGGPVTDDLSSAMIWNATTSVRGSKIGSSASRTRRLGLSVGSGLPGSASPSMHRSRTGVVERLSSLDIPDAGDDDDDFGFLGPDTQISLRPTVESQRSGQSQQQHVLGLLEQIKATLDQNTTGELHGPGIAEGQSSVTFEDLVPPAETTSKTAALNFHFLLSLATDNLITISQDQGPAKFDVRPFYVSLPNNTLIPPATTISPSSNLQSLSFSLRSTPSFAA